MSRRKKRSFDLNEAVEFLNHLLVDKSLLPFVIPLVLIGWAIEKWIFSFSNWVPLVVAVWATTQVISLSYQIFFQKLFLFSLNWVCYSCWKLVMGILGNYVLFFVLITFEFTESDLVADYSLGLW